MRKLFCSLFFVALALNSYSQTDTIWNKIDEYGKKQGYWKKYTQNGVLVYTGYFVNDKPVGLLTRYYENGKKQSELNFDVSSRVAYATMYYNTGDIAGQGKFINQQKDSVWSLYSFYTHELLSKENFKMGIKHGVCTTFYSNGSIQQLQTYDSTIKHGDWAMYFENGNLMMNTTYKKGKLDGAYKAYHLNGQLKIVGFYEANLKEGNWISYDESGKKVNEMPYVKGVPQDMTKFDKLEKEFNVNVNDREKNPLPEVDETNMYR